MSSVINTIRPFLWGVVCLLLGLGYGFLALFVSVLPYESLTWERWVFPVLSFLFFFWGVMEFAFALFGVSFLTGKPQPRDSTQTPAEYAIQEAGQMFMKKRLSSIEARIRSGDLSYKEGMRLSSTALRNADLLTASSIERYRGGSF